MRCAEVFVYIGFLDPLDPKAMCQGYFFLVQTEVEGEELAWERYLVCRPNKVVSSFRTIEGWVELICESMGGLPSSFKVQFFEEEDEVGLFSLEYRKRTPRISFLQSFEKEEFRVILERSFERVAKRFRLTGMSA